jgi:hypothetical protein
MDGMSMIFRTDWQGRQLLFPGWSMSTSPSYLATLAVIFVLGVLSEYVNVQQSRLDAYLVKQLTRQTIPSSVVEPGEDTASHPTHPPQKQVEEVEGEEKESLDPESPDRTVDEADPEPFGGAQYWATVSVPRPPRTSALHDTRLRLLRTCMHLLRSFNAFLLMVTLMSLDVGLVLMVLFGSATGFFFFRASVLLSMRSDREAEHHQ